MSERHRYNRFVLAMCGLAGLLYGIDVGLIAALARGDQLDHRAERYFVKRG